MRNPIGFYNNDTTTETGVNAELYTINPTTGKPVVSVLGCYEYLNTLGYCASVIEGSFELYRVQGHWLESVYPVEMQTQIVNYYQNPKTRPKGFCIEVGVREPKVIEYTYKDLLEATTKYGLGKIVEKNNFNHLKRIDYAEKKHTKNAAYFYFKNGFVEVTAQGAELKNYKQLGWKVNRNRFIDRDIEVIAPENIRTFADKAKRGACFTDFLEKICLQPAKGLESVVHNEEGVDYAINYDKLEYLGQLIGYLLHDYKERGVTDFCVIFCDDEAGGSGKGLIIQALKEMYGKPSETVVEVDAKTDDMKFAPENLSRLTRLKIYSDVERTFNFKAVYNEVTEDSSVRKMHRAPFNIPFEQSWKTILTANHIIKGSKSSDLRRQRVFDLYPYFNDKKQVRETYGHSFFSDDWDSEDWVYFYNTMFACVSSWLQLNYDKSFKGYKDTGYQSRKVQESYIPEFIEFMEKLERDVWHGTGEMYNKFLASNKTEHGYTNKMIGKSIAGNPTLFGRMVTDYLRDKGVLYAKTSDRTKIKVYAKDDNLPF